MKRVLICLLLSLSLLLSGCSFLAGREISIVPHEVQMQPARTDGIAVANYLDLMKALAEMVSAGVGEGVIDISEYNSATIDGGMMLAVRYILEDHPIGSYAVEDIRYEIGTNGGIPALAVNIVYNRTQSQILRIRSMRNWSEAEKAILSALEGFDPGIVLLVDNYVKTDIVQMVEDYALENPQAVMETPYVTVDVYGKGTKRVVDVGFAYQNSREDLRQMQEQVMPVFDAAELYVSGEGSVWQKYNQLYSFLMERFSYSIETSITPAYSLLRHGVGDSRAFAMVYAQMCKSAGVTCLVVKGTCDGEPRTWNMIEVGDRYFHLDLLRCHRMGRYRQFTDGDMEAYVWDFSAYPEAKDFDSEEEAEHWHQAVPETTVPPETTGPSINPWFPWIPPESSAPTEPSRPSEETTEPSEVPTEPEETMAPGTTESVVPEETEMPTEAATEPVETVPKEI